jgi:hypothetical protein
MGQGMSVLGLDLGYVYEFWAWARWAWLGPTELSLSPLGYFIRLGLALHFFCWASGLGIFFFFELGLGLGCC